MGLDRCDDADRETPLTQGRADERGDGARGNPREVGKQGAVVEQVRPEPLGYREHHLPVWYVREQGFLQPQTPKRHALRVATRAEVATLAREREQIFVLAGTTAHAGEAVLEDAAGE